MTAVVKANPFSKTAPNQTVAIFLDDPPPSDALDHAVGAKGRKDAARNTRDLRLLRQPYGEVQTENSGRQDRHGAQYEHGRETCGDGIKFVTTGRAAVLWHQTVSSCRQHTFACA